MITNKNGLKAVAKHASYVIVNGNSIVQPTTQTKKCNNDKCHCKRKTNRTYKKDYIWNSSTYICESKNHLKHVLDDNN